MKKPMPPPKTESLIADVSHNPEKLMKVMELPEKGPADPYFPWDKLRYKQPPSGLTHEEWWLGLKIARSNMRRVLPLVDKAGKPFSFTMPDVVLQPVEEIARDASGQISFGEQVTNPATRDRYLVNSLIEESITSSQLEGASTSRKVAKEMLRTGRPPRSRDERMIINNYQAMRLVGGLSSEKLTVDMICKIHRVVTDGTLENPDASGRFQLPGEDRVRVYSNDDVQLHVPPEADQLPERMERLCRFANGELGNGYIPPVLRAITLHFMLGYEHPFEDGNGRTARILFYWSMLNQGYWLTEFLAISPILKAAPSKYARSYLYSEDDDNDLTYFHIYQLQVLKRSIWQLHDYLAKKMGELKEIQRSLSASPGQFNHRQLAIIEHAAKNPAASFTAQSHMNSHRVAYETARQDLTGLEAKGLLSKSRVGKAYIWIPVADFNERLREAA
ncbi:Fic family protein [Streptacidiphilus sp. MAP5-3]|uniref:Fic family protein n=1 Tax=unclassified Streptacidiphilus TaxID=2643834 RepID=UPI00351763F3